MCGLVAMISKSDSGFAFKSGEMFNQMLYANALRGMDSTGVFGVNKYGNLKLHKSATRASKFMETKAYEEFTKDIFSDYRIVVGHNRASTRGATVDENAHPFLEGHTCLVHNGTLHNHKHMKDVDVDSHAICHAIDEKDYKEVLVEEIDGAFALIWYDGKEKKLHISRNKERPLWIVETPMVDYIASEPTMLYWLIERNSATTAKIEPKYFEVGHVYTYDVGNLKDGFEVEKLPEKKPKPIVVTGKLPAMGGKHLVSVVTDYKQSKKGEQGHNPGRVPLYKGYCYGDEITFEHLNNTIVGDLITFVGETLDGQAVDVCCGADALRNDLAELAGAEYLRGHVSGVSWKGNDAKLILRHDDLAAVTYHQSCNGVLVTDAEIDKHGGACGECGMFIDPIVQAEQFWVRYKGGKIKSMKCQTCVELDEHLQHLLPGEQYVA